MKMSTWRKYKIAEFVEREEANIQTGPFGTQLKASDYVDSGTPVINVRNIGFGEIRAENLEYVGQNMIDCLPSHILEEDDIVFARRGAVERHAFIQSQHHGWMQGSDCIRLRISSNSIEPRFLSYFFLTPDHQEWMKNHGSHGATMATLNRAVISQIQVPLPSVETQRRVVDILSNYDRLIDNNTRRIALLEESIHRLYQEWFVYLRFPGCDRVKVVDGVPEGWEKMPFGDALILQRGFDLPHKDRKRGSIPVYASTGINGFHNVAKVKAPGIVTGRSGSLGSVMYIQQDFWALNTTLWVKEFKQVTVPFAYFLLSNLDLASYQGGSAVPTLNRNAVHAVEITVPDMNIQQKFDEIVHPAFKQIETFNRYNEKLREARDLLLPRLMNGSLAV